MFPDPDDAPPVFSEQPVDFTIAPLVIDDLSLPELGVLFRPRRMDRAAMPEMPSTNTTSLAPPKTKSGLPARVLPRRHPVIPCWRKIAISRSSVPRFPFPWIRAMTCERFAAVKTSLIGIPAGLPRRERGY
jgi:hypothetical protein